MIPLNISIFQNNTNNSSNNSNNTVNSEPDKNSNNTSSSNNSNNNLASDHGAAAAAAQTGQLRDYLLDLLPRLPTQWWDTTLWDITSETLSHLLRHCGDTLTYLSWATQISCATPCQGDHPVILSYIVGDVNRGHVAHSSPCMESRGVLCPYMELLKATRGIVLLYGIIGLLCPHMDGNAKLSFSKVRRGLLDPH